MIGALSRYRTTTAGVSGGGTISKEIKQINRTINQGEGIVIERSQASNKPHESSKTAERRSETLQPSLSIIHTRCCRHNSDTIQQNISELILLTDDNKRPINDLNKDYAFSMICVTSYEDLKKNTNLLLERYACGKLREIVDKLNNDREISRTPHPKPTVGNPSKRAL
ncbi:hypothetical protein DPMN_134141 [Dreissena polymorpha]|uniref:Uncharacterized protein n=1 Tax=Dreissena polymorpha TaxID=45954 RepID=A0A9D4G1H6_DREPO|nr:hypothetical protein DPMN_134141 [Dreissena polymorpha]